MSDSSGLTTDLVTGTGNDMTNNGVASTTGVQGDAGTFVRAQTDDLSIADASQTGLDPSGDFSAAMWLTIPS